MVLLRAVLNILVRNASPRGPMCFRCLIFNLSVKQVAMCLGVVAILLLNVMDVLVCVVVLC